MNNVRNGRHTALLSALLAVIAFALPAQAQQWEPAGLQSQGIHALAFSTQGTLYAASAQGIYRTSNGGAQWEHKLQTSLALPYWEMAVAADGTVYAVSSIDIFTRSPDGGETWITLGQAQILQQFGAIRTIETDRNNFAYVSNSTRVLRSGDQGATWTPKSTGLPSGYPDVQDMAVTPSGVLLAGTGGIVGGHIYGSADNGDSWTRLYEGRLNEDITAVGATQHSTLLASVYSKGLLRSTDEGATWTPVLIDGQTAATATCFTTAGPTVYALIAGRAYRSDDDGATWSALPAIAGVQTIHHLAAYNGTLYAGTPAGVYRFSATTDVADTEAGTPPAVAIAPMPAVGTVHCTYTLARTTAVQIALVDASGRTVRQVFNGTRPAGRHTLAIHVDGLAAGLYLLHIDDGSTATAHPLLIAR